MDYVFESTTEAVNSIGGVALVGKILDQLGFASSDIKHSITLKSIVGLLSQGRTSFEEIALFTAYFRCYEYCMVKKANLLGL